MNISQKPSTCIVLHTFVLKSNQLQAYHPQQELQYLKWQEIINTINIHFNKNTYNDSISN